MNEVNHKRGPRFKDEKLKKSNRIMIRLDDETYWALVDAAMKAGTSLSDYGRVAIEEAIARDRDRRRYMYESS